MSCVTFTFLHAPFYGLLWHNFQFSQRVVLLPNSEVLSPLPALWWYPDSTATQSFRTVPTVLRTPLCKSSWLGSCYRRWVMVSLPRLTERGNSCGGNMAEAFGSRNFRLTGGLLGRGRHPAEGVTSPGGSIEHWHLLQHPHVSSSFPRQRWLAEWCPQAYGLKDCFAATIRKLTGRWR